MTLWQDCVSDFAELYVQRRAKTADITEDTHCVVALFLVLFAL